MRWGVGVDLFLSLNSIAIFRTIFQEMVSMDTLILQMMSQAQKLVNADRASLFLVDNKNSQLYARQIFLCDVQCFTCFV